MSNSHVPLPAYFTPPLPRKTRGGPKLSFEALASINFISLLGQLAPPTLSPELDDHENPPATSVGTTEILAPASSTIPEQEASQGHGDELVAWSAAPPFYGLSEAANWLGVSLATIKRLLTKGSLPHVRIGVRRKIPFSALRAYVVCTRAGCLNTATKLSNQFNMFRRLIRGFQKHSPT